jgi:hypothetical protein
MGVVFPNIPDGAVMEIFTSFCPLCGGVQAIESAEALEHAEQSVRVIDSLGIDPFTYPST